MVAIFPPRTQAVPAEIGRDYAEIEKTTLTRSYPDPKDRATIEETLQAIEYQASLGIDQVILNMGNLTDPAIIELAAKQASLSPADFFLMLPARRTE